MADCDVQVFFKRADRCAERAMVQRLMEKGNDMITGDGVEMGLARIMLKSQKARAG